MQEEELPLLSEPGQAKREKGVLCLLSRRRFAIATLLSGVAMLGMFTLGRETAAPPSSLSSRTLMLHALRRGGYSALPQHTLDAYKLSMVLEPDVETILRAEDTTDDATYSWTITSVDGAAGVSTSGTFSFVDSESESLTGTELHVKFTPANAIFLVTCTSSDGLASASYTATTKYVRREIRTLSTSDREAYFTAMKSMFLTTQPDGEALYGANFISHGHLAALHNTQNYHYHGNLFFQTSHPSMQLKVDRSLLAINSELSLPYWDFLIDADLGEDWASSEVYGEDWFGPVATTESSDYRISGTFEDLKMVYDPDWTAYPESYHTAHGFLGDTLMLGTSEYVQRSNSYCGFESKQGFSTCNKLQDCFSTFESDHDFLSFDLCAEFEVHGNIHDMHAGLWDCEADWKSFYDENSDWCDEMMLSVVAVHMSDMVKVFSTKGIVSCPSVCETMDSEACTCTNTMVDSAEGVDKLTSDHRFDLMQDYWSLLYETALSGSDYIGQFDTPWADLNYTDAYVPLVGKHNDTALAFEQVDLLNALMLKTVLFPGTWGVMKSGASSADPIFWVIHQLFDKATHALRLSERYNTEGFEWNNKAGFMEWEGATPFKQTVFEPYLGAHDLNTTDINGFLRNDQLWSLLDPNKNSIDYVYDQMTTWGSCSFDPFSTSDDDDDDLVEDDDDFVDGWDDTLDDDKR
mmetsp:Transcript_76336/g.153287  ORF Transcript_76336/g.153287 Transcript_76336/m.153287 type:complete len:691 (+) Transcript_76336:53-2125(+)